jgi:cytochrome P450
MTTTTTSTGIPGPRRLPWLGSNANFLRLLLDPVGYVRMCYQRYGPIVGMSKDSTRAVFAFGPEYNHQVLADAERFHSPSFINFPTPSDHAVQHLDAGLITMNGAQHKQHRRMMQPAFHKKQVETYRDDIVAIAQCALERWKVGQTIDIAHEMQQLTLLVASKILFGIDVSADADHLGRMVKRWLEMILSPGVVLFPIGLPGTPYRRALAHAERMEQMYRSMIARKRADISAQDDVVATLMQARDEDGSRLTDAELIGHANTMFIAGHDTSANALTWSLFLLAQHPRALHSLLDEIDGVLHGEAPTVEQLGRLPLLEGTIKESLRLLPPATLIRRDSNAPFELGPYALPAGAVVTISPYVTHHMPELYSEPERFRPERWATIAPTPYEYLPFGAGPHMCIGASFAMLEIKVVLAMILQRYRLTLRPGTRVDRQVRVVLVPKGGMPMMVVARDYHLARVEVRGNIHETVDLT